MAEGGRQPDRCTWRATVDRHFAGRISPQDEAALRAHLPSCEACRRRYDRHLLLSSLTQQRMGPQDRLAIGLGLPARRGPLPVAGHWPVLGGALALGALAIFLLGRGDGRLPFSDQASAPAGPEQPGRAAAALPSRPDAGPADAAPDTAPKP